VEPRHSLRRDLRKKGRGGRVATVVQRENRNRLSKNALMNRPGKKDLARSNHRAVELKKLISLVP